MSIIVCNKLKSWWYSFAILNINKKNSKFAWQYFGTQHLLWVKISFDPTFRWRGLDKINVHTIYNL